MFTTSSPPCLPPPRLLAALARVNPALVFDFDDALYAVPALGRRLQAVLARAVEVAAGSEELARQARRHHQSVTTVPTAVDPREYCVRRGDGGRPVRIGWIGTSGNLPDLELVRPALGALSQIVVPGQTGLLAASGREWVSHLDRLAGDCSLRKRLGVAGRQRVREHYSVDVVAATLAEVLERAAVRARSSAA